VDAQTLPGVAAWAEPTIGSVRVALDRAVECALVEKTEEGRAAFEEELVSTPASRLEEVLRVWDARASGWAEAALNGPRGRSLTEEEVRKLLPRLRP
jgi:hypothetical protein